MVVGGTGILTTYNWDRGLERFTSGTGLIGTTALTTAITIGRAGILTTLPGDLRVEGVTTLVGGETFDGLLTVTSAAGAGAAGVLGPEEVRVENTQAATAGATIRNPGYVNWRGQFWTGAASAAASFGRFGAVVDTIAAGVPTTYRLVWADTAGTNRWSVDEVGVVLAGTGTGAVIYGFAGNPGTGIGRNAADELVLFANSGQALRCEGANVIRIPSGTGVLRFDNLGTAALPTITPTGDPNTGLFWSAADVLGASAGGLAVALFNGNVNGVVGTTLAQRVNTSGTPGLLTATGAAHTTLTAAEATDIYFNLARDVQFTTGAAFSQRAIRVAAPTYSATAATQTINDPTTWYISGAPAAGALVSLVNPKALWVDSGETRLDGILDLSNIPSANPVMRITAATDPPGVTWGAGLGTEASIGPAGYVEIVVAGVARFMPFW